MRSSKTLFITVCLLFLYAILGVRLPLCSAVSETAVQSGNSTSGVGTFVLPNAGTFPLQIHTEKIDTVGDNLSDKIDKASDRASLQFGTWVSKEAFAGITWLKLSICVLLLAVVIIFERIFHTWFLRMQRKGQRRNDQSIWTTVVLVALGRPVSLFILVYGTYGALSPLFSHFQSPQGPNMVRQVAAAVTNMGGMIALVWLTYRFVQAADTYLRKSFLLKSFTIEVLIRRCLTPVKLFVLIASTWMALPLMGSLPGLVDLLARIFSIVLIGVVAWSLIGLANGFGEIAIRYCSVKVDDNLDARRFQTTVHFIKRLAIAVIIILCATSMLMMFEKAKQIGAGLLASAGLLGIVAGLAAQRSIANLLVGLQMAVTQPVRIGDVVIVENEWGTVEEINSTYAVIRIWDQRRLVVPLTYFTEKPFQNWTRTSSELLCTVTLFVDYTVPVESIRKSVNDILEGSRYYDGRVGCVQVTGVTERAMELRVLMSAKDASDAWELRCEVREKLIAFIQSNFPDGFPKVRTQFEGQVTQDPFAIARKTGKRRKQHEDS